MLDGQIARGGAADRAIQIGTDVGSWDRAARETEACDLGVQRLAANSTPRDEFNASRPPSSAEVDAADRGGEGGDVDGDKTATSFKTGARPEVMIGVS